jgi:alkylation response protein AidB-like acyl-CoA dehydrogenase
MNSTAAEKLSPGLTTLPSDEVRQIMWRFADRYELHMLVQSVRGVARGPVAQLVAAGGRNTHEWTAEKNHLLQHYDESGITAAGLDPEQGGFIAGPKNMALALVAFELAWVDAGAATGSLATNLGLAPIHECGTPEQVAKYVGGAAPLQPGETRKQIRAAFALTEPLPFVGVETGMLSGKVRIVEWKDGSEPMLQVDKRGRFITNMGFANVVTAAVDSDDPRIKGSCMVILEEGDPGIWDRGTATKKLVHQLSSTNDPVFNLKVPASRIVGGYTVKNGVIIPNCSHGDVIEAVFRRTRVPVGVMTSAKLLSAVEPVILYHRRRFRGGECKPGTPRYELGIQQKEDALHRLVDVWATGEASASLGFYAARLFDLLDPQEREKNRLFAEKKLTGRAALKELAKQEAAALELVKLNARPAAERDAKRVAELESELLVQFSINDSLANVFCPACKLWNTGYGANMMREAVSLMGGYGVTEDCPGFLGQKWMDAQLEATYEGPEVVQRMQLSITMVNKLFLAQFEQWIVDLRQLAGHKPGTGAGVLAQAMQLWLWTIHHAQTATDADGAKLYHKTRQGVTFPLADALSWLLGARQFILDVVELETKGAENPALADGLAGTVNFFNDLCQVQSARAAGEVGRVCAEIVYGYNCPGKPDKAGFEEFEKMRTQLDGGLAGSRLAKDCAAESLSKVMTREALDYPM